MGIISLLCIKVGTLYCENRVQKGVQRFYSNPIIQFAARFYSFLIKPKVVNMLCAHKNT